jgi:hypothetical protein
MPTYTKCGLVKNQGILVHWNLLGKSALSQVDKADILLCIYTGEGGWAKETGDIGICQGEMETTIEGQVYV